MKKILILSCLVAQVQSQVGFWPQPGNTDATKDSIESSWGETKCTCNDVEDPTTDNACEKQSGNGQTTAKCVIYGNAINRANYCNKVNSDGTGKAGYSVCGYSQTCATVKSNEILNQCISKGAKLCGVRQYLGGNGETKVESVFNALGVTVAAFECKSTETCCDFECCSQDQICWGMEGTPSASNRQGFAQIMAYAEAPSSAFDFYYDFTFYNLADVQRSGWLTPDGKPFKNRPRTCIPKMTALSGTKFIYVPLVCCVLVVAALVVAVLKFGCKQSRNMAPFVMIGASFFLIFSFSWMYGIITVLLAAATVFAPRAKRNGWLILAQLLIFWFVLGGSTWLVSPGLGGGLSDFITPAQFSTLQTTCASYYNQYFKFGTQTPFYISALDTAWGFCSRPWLGFLVVVAYTQLFAFVVMIFQTLTDFFVPSQVEYEWSCCSKKGDDNESSTGADESLLGSSNDSNYGGVSSSNAPVTNDQKFGDAGSLEAGTVGEQKDDGRTAPVL